MAAITVTVGALSGTKSASNAKAQVIMQAFVEEMNGPVNGTDQAKLDFIAARLVAYLEDTARGGLRKVRLLAAEAAASDEATTVGWT